MISNDTKPVVMVQPQGDMNAVLLAEGPSYTPELSWKDGVFDCVSQCAPSCCMSFWCPCVMIGQMSQKLGMQKCQTVVLIYALGATLIIILSAVAPARASWINFFFALALFIMTCTLRVEIRKRYFIKGTTLNDCCCSYWCTFCVLAQLARQIYDYKSTWDGCPFSETGENAV